MKGLHDQLKKNQNCFVIVYPKKLSVGPFKGSQCQLQLNSTKSHLTVQSNQTINKVNVIKL